jgi:hypothetical protein
VNTPVFGRIDTDGCMCSYDPFCNIPRSVKIHSLWNMALKGIVLRHSTAPKISGLLKNTGRFVSPQGGASHQVKLLFFEFKKADCFQLMR